MSYDLVIATTTCFKQYGHVKDGEYRKRLFDKYLESFGNSKAVSKKILVDLSEDDGIGWNQNYLRLLARVKNLAPLCLIVDSDGYFDPSWELWLYDAMERFPEAAGWCLYNSPRMKQYDGNDLGPDSFERKHVSPHGLCFRTEDYTAPAEGEWFENFIGELPKKHSMGFVVPKVSLIQHCGAYGLNNVPGGSEDFDPNFPWNKECLDVIKV